MSASTAMACAHAIGIHRECFERFARRVRGNPANFYPRRALEGRRVTPHFEMYRETVLECVTRERFAALQQSPSRVRFLVALAPRLRPLAVLLASTVIVTKGRAPLMRAHAIDVRALDGPDALADAILASSAFPPFTPMPRIAGRLAVDGGVVEMVPLSLASPGARVTAVLTRPRPWRPLPPSVRVIAPRRELPVAMWDYSDERGITVAYDEGRRAGEAIAAQCQTAQVE